MASIASSSASKLRALEQHQAAQQEQLKQLVKSLPKEVRAQRKQQIEQLQGNISKSMKTIRDIESGALSSRHSRASTAASSTARSVQSARQLNLRDSVTSKDAYGATQRTAFQPPPRRSSQEFPLQSPQFKVPSRTAPGVAMEHPKGPRWSQCTSRTSSAHLDIFGYPIEQGSWAGTSDAGMSEKSQERYSEASSSYYSGCSTPVAGRTWGHLTRTFGNGLGRAHLEPPHAKGDYFRLFSLMQHDPESTRGKPGENNDDLSCGRLNGSGKRYLGGEECHMRGPMVQRNPTAGLHGHYKGDDFEGGLERYVGHGLKKFDRSQYHRHHISDDIESEPGLHGHTKDFDYKDGMEWYIGHGKRRVQADHHKVTWKARDISETKGSPDDPEFPAAGMSTRDITIQQLARDPTRQGTHQDRRAHTRLRKDQYVSGQLALPGPGLSDDFDD